MYKLQFINSAGRKRNIATIKSRGKTGWQIYCEAKEHINAFLEEHNFTSYYTRIWNTDAYTVLDVGSHTEFFHIVPVIDVHEGEPNGET